MPIYNELWRAAGFSPKHFRSINDLALLPIVSKGDFKRFQLQNNDFAQNIDKKRFVGGVTSGSTGEPFRFFLDSAYIAEKFVLGKRIWRWANTNVYAPKVLCAPKSAQNYYPNLLYFDLGLLQKNKLKYIDIIRKTNTRCIFGTPIMTLDFLQTIKEKAPEITFDVAVLGGHAVAPGLRAYLKKEFNCETFEFYASGETRMIGIECEKHSALHLQENIIVEIVGADGNPLPDGTLGKIIVTTLSNKVMPFIRYELGDVGAIIAERCSCGRTSKRILVEGRTNEPLMLRPDGESIAPSSLRDILDKYFTYFERYQLVQAGFKTFTLHIVPTPQYSSKIGHKIIAKMRAGALGAAKLIIKIEKKITPLPSGKFKYFVSNLREDKLSQKFFEPEKIEKRLEKFNLKS